MKSLKTITAITLASMIASTPFIASAKDHNQGIGKPDRAMIYVTSQNKIYESVLLKELPYNSTTNYQLLEFAGPTGAQTAVGPRDTDYYGGRWWVDSNSNGHMDEEDFYFLCPLLGPGKEYVED
ncbi:hypothetical protein E2K93_02260 [Thalassotalea sp. HSM 43]|uniref:hypothetical protein n=1 Tax=Thalassotalea sp. HSM 43 TaxID=2552945 RepID=UPI00108177CD|nr:hypothetical protein [Thalassotalea sp. HSM 43]QBY03264.1 hypothetical protein E2K93_02260 [Thalassotalea sp. HSM 43]